MTDRSPTLIPTLTEEPPVTSQAQFPEISASIPAPRPGSRSHILYALWTAAIVGLFVLHFPHLLADFPNNSPWMDYSKYTDEGWYANAAIRHYVSGHWYLRGDFNPAVALPVWPLLVAAVFHFTGVSVVAARALALAVLGINLLLTYRIVRARAPRWTAMLAVTVLAANPFLYAFSRLAILEPLLMCFLLLSWLCALRLPRASARAQNGLLIAAGVLLCLLVLTKTTAIFILLSTLYLIAHAYGFRLRASLRALAITAVSAAVPWSAWYFLFVRPHYRVDYQYLFDANKWPQPDTLGGRIAAFWYALHGALWISPVLCIVAVALLLLGLVPSRRSSAHRPDSLWRNPLIIASLLAAGGYIFFTGWHNNPQPRYYETVVYPLAIVLALGTAALLRRSLFLRLAGTAALAVIAGASLVGVWRIAGYFCHPEYTWRNAATGLTRYIDQHPGPNRMLLSISSDEISLFTHLPGICDDFGPWDLAYRIHVYQPGWYAAWNELDPGTLVDLQTHYSLEPVASFPAFDDPDRNLLILYRLHPLPATRDFDLEEEEAANAGR